MKPIGCRQWSGCLASRGLLAVAMVFFAGTTVSAVDVRVVPLWDGETSGHPDDSVMNRFGGNLSGPVPITHVTVPAQVRTGVGAYKATLAIPASNFTFFQMVLTGLSGANVMSRDLDRFAQLSVWYRNTTGAPFTLKLEIKDDRDQNQHRLSRSFPVPASNQWRNIVVPLNSFSGWTVEGQPNLDRARFIGFVFETAAQTPVNGDVFFDDVVLVEPGLPVDVNLALSTDLLRRLVRRQFDAMWGSRSRIHGLIPQVSPYADIAATNSTAAVVKVLPTAIRNGWVTQQTANAYMDQLVGTLNTVMNSAHYVPARYINWATLMPSGDPNPQNSSSTLEESPVDAAFLALALYQYQAQSATPPAQRQAILALLGRFNFAAFGSAGGWRLAYKLNSMQFTGHYDGYSGEGWAISLAAHLMPNNQVPIGTYFHKGTKRVKDYCATPIFTHMVHTDDSFRAPFMQWLFPTFVDVSRRGLDTYPIANLRTNPYLNAVIYEVDTVIALRSAGRSRFLQADAADDGTGTHYEQFSCHKNFGQPHLTMPWSATCVLPADGGAAMTSIRYALNNGLHGPFGLADSVTWQVPTSRPTRLAARADLWNTGLSTMYLSNYLYADNRLLSNLSAVDAALDQVYTNGSLVEEATAAIRPVWQGAELAIEDFRVRTETYAGAAP